MLGKAILTVRATVPAAEREAFDTWYREDHLPDATTAFGAERAWRGWCAVDPAVHVAFYQFSDPAAAAAIEHTGALARLVADFDRTWQGRVQRVREVVHCSGAFVPPA